MKDPAPERQEHSIRQPSIPNSPVPSEQYRPYFRFQYINAGTGEPIYGDPTDGPVVGRRQGPSAGIRYDLNQHAAFKLQYDRITIRGEGTDNGLQSQLAFTF